MAEARRGGHAPC
ncbi:hypothetical protein E2C01_085225 [Portunus trituberculatus]|uniref:Uncharacterized protein n=1 Tax=Portunus trituberculatus TaxID=210409 RepID=A0A5B7J666_PORTR|nr:hypothetical protein [Portunus trituberculatus]